MFESIAVLMAIAVCLFQLVCAAGLLVGPERVDDGICGGGTTGECRC